MMTNKSFCAFILTHGRADNVITYNVLRKQGYSGMIRLVVDDEDADLPRYKERYGSEVLVFSKDEAKKLFDPMDNFNERCTITFARCICWKLAKELGVKNFVELDDDYSHFAYRYNRERFYAFKRTDDLDAIFDIFIDFLNATPATFIAFSQDGDFIGGERGTFGKKIFLKRKAMNSFFCKTDTPCYFRGTFNEDVNSYTTNGNRGVLYFTHNIISLHQEPTQQSSGGISEAYKKFGTYVKSFFTVMMMPSCVKISMMGNHVETMRIHHKIQWKYCVPKILNERHKKSMSNQK